MSKKLIAGAGVVASFAVALAPLATFATITRNNESDIHTDRLNVTVAPACSFGTVVDGTVTDGIVHTNGAADSTVDSAAPAAAWTEATDSGYGRIPDADAGTYGTNAETVDSFAYGIYAGTTKDNMATTTLTIFCNNAGGYTVKAVTNDLLEWDTTEDEAVTSGKTIPADGTYSAAKSGYAIFSVEAKNSAGTADTDAAAIDASAKFTASTAAAIAHKTGVSKENGDNITMTYGIGVAPSQKAALYRGDVVYTLFQGYNS